MAIVEIIMPTMGESIFECTVLKWLIKEGDTVEIDDMIIEVATDKIDTEIGSSHAGKVTKFLVKEGEMAIIGKPICEIEVNGAETPIVEKIPFVELVEKKSEVVVQKSTENLASGDRFYSPLVLNIAKTENISQNELDQIQGSGLDNRVTKEDIFNYLENRGKSEAVIEKTVGNDTIIEMDRMRKMIADRMVESKKTSAHVTSFIETDMTQIVDWRNQIKDKFQAKYAENLTFTPLLVKAIADAIKKYPNINSQVNGETIIVKKDINIGMAVALPNGNLIVPIIHNADKLDLIQLTKKVNDLANRARNNQLKPNDLQGGTYTISNIGSFGNLAGTPIILQPQVAIMAFGVIRKMPAVIETPQGDFIGIRQKMMISHSYDHRIVDGSLGGLFLKEVSDNLEKYDTSIDII